MWNARTHRGFWAILRGAYCEARLYEARVSTEDPFAFFRMNFLSIDLFVYVVNLRRFALGGRGILNQKHPHFSPYQPCYLI